MCGIVGYVGSKDAYPILIKGLHRLEYRGYDSAGIALINPAGKLNVYKSKGKVAELEHFVEDKDTSGTIGIAHTRWATHGEPNDVNAHPHPPAYAGRGDIAVRRDYGHADGPAPRVRAGIHGAVDLQHAGGVDTARIRCRQIIDSLKGMPAKIQWVLDTQAGTAR